jgi:hypothetical protein
LCHPKALGGFGILNTKKIDGSKNEMAMDPMERTYKNLGSM